MESVDGGEVPASLAGGESFTRKQMHMDGNQYSELNVACCMQGLKCIWQLNAYSRATNAADSILYSVFGESLMR